MKAKIYHNPKCGTSRKALALLNEEGHDVEIVDYLKTPPGIAELRRLYEKAGIKPSEGLRRKEGLVADLGLLDGITDEEGILAAIAAHPILMERPVVETEKGAVLARPHEKVRDIL